MKVEIKPIAYTKAYKVFGNDWFLGYVTINPSDKWLFTPNDSTQMRSMVFDSYDEMYDWLVWSDY